MMNTNCRIAIKVKAKVRATNMLFAVQARILTLGMLLTVTVRVCY